MNLSRNNNVDYATSALLTELNCTCRKSKQGVVFTAAYVATWVEVSSTLTNNDFSCVYFLT
jgi:hypothetical protein